MDYNNKLKKVNASNDSLMINEDQQTSILGVSIPQNRTKINAVKAPRMSTSTLYCSGDAYVYGSFKTPVKLDKGLLFNDGTETAPSIVFENDPNTGLYRVTDGSIGVSTNGSTRLVISDGSIELREQITTDSGNLVLNPAGPSIDFTGHTLLNVGGVSINLGNPNQVVITDGTGGLVTELYLAQLRGGTGGDSSAATGVAHVTSGNWTYAPITDSDFGTITNFTSGQITVNNLVSPSDVVTFPATNIKQTAANFAGGESLTIVENIQTVGATQSALLDLATSQGAGSGTIYTVHAVISLGDTTGGAETGSYTFVFNAKNIGGALTFSSVIQLGSILDGALAGTSIAPATSGAHLLVNVSGVLGKTINWIGRFDVISQQF